MDNAESDFFAPLARGEFTANPYARASADVARMARDPHSVTIRCGKNGLLDLESPSCLREYSGAEVSEICPDLKAAAAAGQLIWLGKVEPAQFASSQEAADCGCESSKPKNYFALTDQEIPPENAFHLRKVGRKLSAIQAGAATRAVALSQWHRASRFCGSCGAPTQVIHSGWVRQCTGCGTEIYPRHDPSIIVSVIDDQDRILLAKNVTWRHNTYSVLAGFVEAGESGEQTVVREVFEEVGVRVEDIKYLGSQPWPFPRSLMLAYTARTHETELTLQPEEIAKAAFFTREELAQALAEGRFEIPAPASIARALIEHWYGQPLP